MKRIRSSTVLLSLTSLVVGTDAWGQAASKPGTIPTPGATPVKADADIWVAYDAPPNCPNASVFMERLRARTAHVALAPVASAARLAVIVSSTETDSSARIQFSGADVLPEIRTVSGRTCDEVVHAAALITALAIEASSSGASPFSANPQDATERRTPARETLPPLSSGEPPSAWLRSWGFGATGGFESWQPGGGFSWGGFGEFAARPPFDLVRLTMRVARGSAAIDAQRASFMSLTARVTICPLSWRIAEPVFLIPCAGVDVGRLVGEGEISADLPTSRSAAILWSSAEAILLARWHLAGAIALEAGGEFGFPLIRHTFTFDGPTRPVYEVPVVGAGAHLAFALRFH